METLNILLALCEENPPGSHRWIPLKSNAQLWRFLWCYLEQANVTEQTDEQA